MADAGTWDADCSLRLASGFDIDAGTTAAYGRADAGIAEIDLDAGQYLDSLADAEAHTVIPLCVLPRSGGGVGGARGRFLRQATPP